MMYATLLLFGLISSIKLLFALALAVAGGAAILVAYKKWTWMMKMVLGKERVMSLGTNTLAIGFYIGGGTLILLALLLLAP
jgi:hypothetical protein